MKVVVTGSSGFVGKNCVKYLKNKNLNVVGISRHLDIHTDYKIDITQKKGLIDLLNKLNPDVIVHAAAYTNVERAEMERGNARKVNVEGIRNLTEWCDKNRCKLIFISSDYVYDGRNKRGCYTESDICNPLNYYGETKLAAEKEVSKLNDSVILRTTAVFGHDPGGTNFLMQMLRNTKKRKIPTDQIGNPTHVDLLCEYIYGAIDKNLTGIFNATGFESMNRYEFSLKIANVFNLNKNLLVPAKTKELGQIAKRPLYCRTDSSKIQKTLDIPKITVENQLKDIKKNLNSKDNLKKKMFVLLKEYYFQHLNKPSETIPVSGKKFDELELYHGLEALLDGWWTEGRVTKEFEKRFNEFLGVKHIIVVNSGSSANLLAMRALTSKKLGKKILRKGDEVLTVAAGFPTTVNPIIQCDLVPVFVDVDLGTYNANITQLKKAISPKTKAIFLAHTLGNPFDIEKVKELCNEHKLWLIEDACDALGSKYNDQYVGTFGDLATFSFYPAHHITMGEGGSIVTNNDKLAKILRSVRDWGRDCWCKTGEDNACGRRFSQKLGDLPYGYDHKYTYSELGYNLKNTDLNVAIGLAQLKKLGEFIKTRKRNFHLLKDGLKEFDNWLISPEATENSEPSWFGFLITLKDNCNFSREELTEFLNEKKIGTRLLFGGNIIKQPYFKDLNYKIVGNLKNTDIIMNKTFWIGVSPLLNRKKIDHVIDVFKEFFKKTA